MSAINDGGPAFPQASPEMVIAGQSIEETQGMTLRDYFAAAALQGQLSCAQIIGGSVTGNEVALSCYNWADLMLAARKEVA